MSSTNFQKLYKILKNKKPITYSNSYNISELMDNFSKVYNNGCPSWFTFSVESLEHPDYCKHRDETYYRTNFWDEYISSGNVDFHFKLKDKYHVIKMYAPTYALLFQELEFWAGRRAVDLSLKKYDPETDLGTNYDLTDIGPVVKINSKFVCLLTIE